MFDIGWTEMLVIAAVMIVVVGPKDLPKMLRTFGRTTAKMRSMAGEFQKHFNEALREAELDDVKKSVDTLRSLNPVNEIRKQLNPLEKAAADVRAGLDAALKPSPSPEPASPTADAQPQPPLKDGAAGPGAGELAASVEPPSSADVTDAASKSFPLPKPASPDIAGPILLAAATETPASGPRPAEPLKAGPAAIPGETRSASAAANGTNHAASDPAEKPAKARRTRAKPAVSPAPAQEPDKPKPSPRRRAAAKKPAGAAE